MFGLDEIYKFKLFLISFIYLPPPPKYNFLPTNYGL